VTSSGTWNYSLSNGEAVLDAFERCGIPTSKLVQEHFLTARRQLSLLLNSEWSNRQVNLFTVAQNTLSLVQGTATYTLPANVVMILDAYRSTTSGGVTTDIFMTPISLDDYSGYPQKQTQAPPTVYYLNRQATPTVTVYPVPDSGGPYTFTYWCCTQIQDASISSGQTPAIPVRWYDALCAGMAYRLARVYAPTLEDKRKQDYKDAWDLASEQDLQNTPVKVAPRMMGYWS